MTEARILRSVQVPLALPLILNGIRLSSAAVLATVPLAAAGRQAAVSGAT